MTANPCLPALQQWLRAHPGLQQGEQATWAVAFSGGADSTALLLAAADHWPGRALALHVHHGLQPAADSFLAQARAFCAARGMAFDSRLVQAGHLPGQSPEDAARQARYRALADMAQAHGVPGVLLAQHADDQLETVLLALSRGAGLPGLAAMPASMCRHGVVFGRPLLEVTAHVLRHWLQAQGIPWVEDPSNQDQRYTRNRLRAQVVPPMLAAFPAMRQTVARAARHAAQAQVLLTEVAAQDLQCCGQPPRIASLQALSPARQANVLRHWLRQVHGVGPSEAQLQALQRQLVACTTRGHRIELRVAHGQVSRAAERLVYTPSL